MTMDLHAHIIQCSPIMLIMLDKVMTLINISMAMDLHAHHKVQSHCGYMDIPWPLIVLIIIMLDKVIALMSQ